MVNDCYQEAKLIKAIILFYLYFDKMIVKNNRFLSTTREEFFIFLINISLMLAEYISLKNHCFK